MRKTAKAVAESMRSLAYTASLKMTLDGMEVELIEQRSSRERIGPCPEREKSYTLKETGSARLGRSGLRSSFSEGMTFRIGLSLVDSLGQS